MANTAEATNAAIYADELPLRVVESKETMKWAQFQMVLNKHRGEKLLLILTGYPDPDNIASGLAHQFLANEFDIETTLLCFHEVSHQENRL